MKGFATATIIANIAATVTNVFPRPAVTVTSMSFLTLQAKQIVAKIESGPHEACASISFPLSASKSHGTRAVL
jgi:hypothetical protein